MQKPPLELPPIYITPDDPHAMEPFRDRQGSSYNGIYGPAGANQSTREKMYDTQIALEQEFGAKSVLVPQSIEVELAATRLEGTTHPLPPAAALVRELGVRSTLIQRKSAELHRQTAVANSFFGSDPIDKSFKDFLDQASAIWKTNRTHPGARELWGQSYRAAHETRLLTQALQLLYQQSMSVQQALHVLQADEARIAAEQEIQRRAAELVRLEAEEAQRAAAAAAETARLIAEAQARDEEQARTAGLAAALAEAEAEAEAERETERARIQLDAQANLQNPTVANSGLMAALGPAFSGITGAVNVSPTASLALQNGLRAAVASVSGAIATATAPILVGFAALLVPARLGNGDLHTVSVPLSELATVSDGVLYERAATGGDIDLPLRLGSTTSGNRIEIVIAATDGVTIPANVPVRLARFDGARNVYVSVGTMPDGPVITWTPLVEPQDPSTSFPIAQTDLPVYEGATVTPNQGRIDTSPLLDDYDFGGFITVFPAESGIPPLFVAFNSPYEGATALGEHSGRNFNPEQAGGPILDLDWRTAVITQAGVDGVKLHISRLDQSDANDVMVQRLEKILSGQEVVTDTDLRYYTHEIRELERFRALGLSDSFNPENGSPTWNNAHTATLEDYKLSSDDTLLYSPDAITAGNKQLDSIYEQILKGAYE